MNDIEKALEYLKDPIGRSYLEFEEYEKIVKDSLQKQLLVKPLGKTKGPYFYYGVCPVCNSVIHSNRKYCGDCGRPLDWSDNT